MMILRGLISTSFFCVLLLSCEKTKTVVEQTKEKAINSIEVVTDNITDTYNIVYKKFQGRVSPAVSDSMEQRLLWRIIENKFSRSKRIDNQYNANSREAMIDTLSSMLVADIEDGIQEIIDLRCGLWSIPRIFYQTLFVSDETRRHDWATAIKERVSDDDIEKRINSQIKAFNTKYPDKALNLVALSEITDCDIIDDLAFERIKGREWLEWAGALIDILIAIIIGYLIGHIIGFFIGSGNIISIITAIMSFIASLFILTPKYMAYESGIVEAILNNYMNYLSAQSIIEQMF